MLEALVACAGVTVSAVATAMGVKLRGGRVIAEGQWDARGTRGVDREARNPNPRREKMHRRAGVIMHHGRNAIRLPAGAFSHLILVSILMLVVGLSPGSP
jgi:hypothetical protein